MKTTGSSSTQASGNAVEAICRAQREASAQLGSCRDSQEVGNLQLQEALVESPKALRVRIEEVASMVRATEVRLVQAVHDLRMEIAKELSDSAPRVDFQAIARTAAATAAAAAASQHMRQSAASPEHARPVDTRELQVQVSKMVQAALQEQSKKVEAVVQEQCAAANWQVQGFVDDLRDRVGRLEMALQGLVSGWDRDREPSGQADLLAREKSPAPEVMRQASLPSARASTRQLRSPCSPGPRMALTLPHSAASLGHGSTAWRPPGSSPGGLSPRLPMSPGGARDRQPPGCEGGSMAGALGPSAASYVAGCGAGLPGSASLSSECVALLSSRAAGCGLAGSNATLPGSASLPGERALSPQHGRPPSPPAPLFQSPGNGGGGFGRGSVGPPGGGMPTMMTEQLLQSVLPLSARPSTQNSTDAPPTRSHTRQTTPTSTAGSRAARVPPPPPPQPALAQSLSASVFMLTGSRGPAA
mmetsp:Transcript_79523/g.219958  ORF Transcript_79523/g.219958 Transcript_79523/m.219958 type:complete len:473 (-) Transcript_79523:79-1497(-)